MPKETFFNLPPDKREKFLEIAIAEFAENDYQNASMSRIVSKAGIAKGSFYQYFVDKEELYRYLLDLGMQEKARFLSTPPPHSPMNVFAYLRWLIQAGVRFELANPYLSQIGYRAVKNGTLPDDLMVQARAGAQAFFGQLLAQGKKQGDIAADIDEDLAAFMFQAIFTELGGYIMKRLPADETAAWANGRALADDSEAKALLEQVLHIFESGLRRQNKETPPIKGQAS